MEDIEYILNDDIGLDYVNDFGFELVVIFEDKYVVKDVVFEEVFNIDFIDVMIKLNVDEEVLLIEREYVLFGVVYFVKLMVFNRVFFEDENGFEFVLLFEDNSLFKCCVFLCLKKSFVKLMLGNNEEMLRNIINFL